MILIPTHFEQNVLQPLLRELDQPIEVCGFGPVAAAARTAQLLAKHKPAAVTLVGIAGTYCEQYSIGSAHTFGTVSCYGIGAAAGDEFQTAGQMGWPHIADDSVRIGDTITLDSESQSNLITVCAASGNTQDAERHLSAFPNSHAEDMEGFSVALACVLADTPLRIVRGISNVAGDRDKANWKIDAALSSAAELTMKLLRPS